MRRSLLVVLSLLLFAPAAFAAGKLTTLNPADVQTATQLRDTALHDDTAWAFTEGLTTEVGARLAGSPNDAKAREWVIAKFKTLGFDKVWTEAVTYPKWVRRSEHAEIVAPFPQALVLSALGHSPGTAAGGISAEVVDFDSFAALKAADPASVRGKIVYVGARMQAYRDGHDYGIGSNVRVNGPSLASQKGAAAFLLRSAGTDNNRLPHTGITTFALGVTPIPAAALSGPDADQLERVLRIGKPVTIKLALDCGIEGVYTGANIIAELRGSRKPDEYFVMGGHLDSWTPVPARSTMRPASASRSARRISLPRCHNVRGAAYAWSRSRTRKPAYMAARPSLPHTARRSRTRCWAANRISVPTASGKSPRQSSPRRVTRSRRSPRC